MERTGVSTASKKRGRALARPPPMDVEEVDEDEPVGALPRFPPGVRFAPHDPELIEHYLIRKIRQLPLPGCFVRTVNLYKHHPHNLTKIYECTGEEEIWYFLTPRSRKYANGDRPDRSAYQGRGYWRATGADKTITNTEKHILGYKKSLVYFEGKQPKGIKTKWMMHEYRIDERREPVNQQRPFEPWVLCKVYNGAKIVEDNSSDSKSEVSTVPYMPSDPQVQHRTKRPKHSRHCHIASLPERSAMVSSQQRTINGDTALIVPPINSQAPIGFLRGLPLGTPEMPLSQSTIVGRNIMSKQQYLYNRLMCGAGPSSDSYTGYGLTSHNQRVSGSQEVPIRCMPCNGQSHGSMIAQESVYEYGNQVANQVDSSIPRYVESFNYVDIHGSSVVQDDHNSPISMESLHSNNVHDGSVMQSHSSSHITSESHDNSELVKAGSTGLEAQGEPSSSLWEKEFNFTFDEFFDGRFCDVSEVLSMLG